MAGEQSSPTDWLAFNKLDLRKLPAEERKVICSPININYNKKGLCDIDLYTQ